MKNFLIKTFGCKTNQIESGYICETLRANNFNEVKTIEHCDICIVNSCTVTQMADKKVLQYINTVKKKNKNIKVVLIGCFAQANKGSLEKNKNIDVAIGNSDKLKVLDYINEINKVSVKDIDKEKDFESFLVTKISKSRANVKIQDGCNNFCSYCIIPYVRGRSRSNNLENIINQINKLEEMNYKEIVLTGINIGKWGLDINNDMNLKNLILEIEKTNIKRFRLGSLTPEEIDDELLEILYKSNKFCAHFHLSVQSLCNKTLKNMNRKYDEKLVINLTKKIKDKFNTAFIGSDIIVGFPMESNEDFNITYNNLKESKIDKIHCFPYSIRPNTKASKMEGHIEDSIKTHRTEMIKKLSEDKYLEFLKSNLNLYEEVIIEKVKNKNTIYYKGITSNYISVLCERTFDGIKKVKLTKIIGDKILVE